MSFSGCIRVLRHRSSALNSPFNGVQKLGNGSACSEVILMQLRAISSSVVNGFAANGVGNGGGNGGGPKKPFKLPVGLEDKLGPESAEDRRMWRTWIEGRLAKSGNGFEGTDSDSTGFGGSQGEETLESSPRQVKETPDRFSAAEGLSSGKGLSRFGSFFKPAGNGNGNGNDGRQAPRRTSRASLDDLPVEALDDFETRVLGSSANEEKDSIDNDFLRDLDEIGRSARGLRSEIDDNVDISEDEEDWGDDNKSKMLTDLALANMEMFDLEDEENPYRMRSDRLFFPGQTYDAEDLDLSKEAALEKPTIRTRKKYPSKEVLQVADFRNPRYLSKFIRETSRILPRRHFQISAKAQRKVAKEIKTARILGLMPFTSMGDPPFRFLRSRSEEDPNDRFEDY